MAGSAESAARILRHTNETLARASYEAQNMTFEAATDHEDALIQLICLDDTLQAIMQLIELVLEPQHVSTEYFASITNALLEANDDVVFLASRLAAICQRNEWQLLTFSERSEFSNLLHEQMGELLTPSKSPYDEHDSAISKSVEDLRIKVRAAVQQVALARAQQTLVENAQKSDEVLKNQRRAAGKSGSEGLSKFFHRYGRRQGWIASGWRVLAILSIAGAALTAFFAVPSGISTADLVHRLALSALGLVLGGFFGAEAAKHASASRFGKLLGVQLDTLDAYCEPFDDDMAAKGRVREQFASRVFGDGLSADSGTSGLPQLESLFDLLKNRSGG